MGTNPLVELGRLGQSPWYDYITRDLIASGKLARLIAEDGLRGMTSNPTIFEKAISGSEDYDDDIRQLASLGRAPQEIFEALSVADVQAACDVFRPVYDATGGADGLVSLEVNPELGDDTAGTIAEAKRLWTSVDRPNAMIKIPATAAGIPAIEESLAEGISINITLLFSVARYDEVIEAFFRGLERRRAAGWTPSSMPGEIPTSSGAPSPSPTPVWPTRRSSAPAPRRGGACSPRRGRAPSGRSGLRPAPRIRPIRTFITWRRWCPPIR
jgi:transaldolase